MKALSIILIVLSILTLSGLFLSSGAPQEAVVVALSCYLAILARIAQASHHHSSK